MSLPSRGHSRRPTAHGDAAPTVFARTAGFPEGAAGQAPPLSPAHERGHRVAPAGPPQPACDPGAGQGSHCHVGARLAGARPHQLLRLLLLLSRVTERGCAQRPGWGPGGRAESPGGGARPHGGSSKSPECRLGPGCLQGPRSCPGPCDPSRAPASLSPGHQLREPVRLRGPRAQRRPGLGRRLCTTLSVPSARPLTPKSSPRPAEPPPLRSRRQLSVLSLPAATSRSVQSATDLHEQSATLGLALSSLSLGSGQGRPRENVSHLGA